MNYYRKTVDNVVDNVKLRMQMDALTLKLSENKNNISSNLNKINANTLNVSSNTNTLSNIDNDLINLRGRLNTHQSDIQKINTNTDTNTTNISSNTTTLSNIDSDLLNLRSRLNTHQTDIQSLNGLKIGYKIKDIFIFDIDNNLYQDMNVNNPKFNIFDKNVIYNFTKDSYFIIDMSILSKFNNHYINIQFFFICY